jgi:hypothetical protein
MSDPMEEIDAPIADLRPEFPGQHVWAVHAVFRIEKPLDWPPVMGTENLAVLTPIICFTCEMPFAVVGNEDCTGQTHDDVLIEEARRSLGVEDDGD